MTDSYHFANMPASEQQARLAECFNNFFARRAKALNPLSAGLTQQQSIGPFGSGATLKTSGDKIVGRVSGTLTGVKVTVGAGGYSGVTLVSGGGSGGSGRAEPTQTEADVSQAIETILNSPMKRRDNLPPAPLPHFNQRTEFDAFPDYVVFHEFEPVAPLHTSPTTDSAYPAIAGLLRG